MLIVGSIPMKEKLFFVGQNERKSNSMKKLSSCSILALKWVSYKIKNCAGKIFAIALDFLSYTGIKHFISNYNRSISKSYLG